MSTEFPHKTPENIRYSRYPGVLLISFILTNQAGRIKAETETKTGKSLMKGHVFTEFWNTHLNIVNKKIEVPFIQIPLIVPRSTSKSIIDNMKYFHFCH